MPDKFVDYVSGQKFGDLEIVSFSESRRGRGSWLCKCSCGKQRVILTQELKKGKQNCGKCNRIELGQVFGRLVVVAKAPKINLRSAWLCKCKCQKERIILAQSLKSGATKSCGCLWYDVVIVDKRRKTQVTARSLIGQKRSKWTIVDVLPRRAKNGGLYFLCRCDCNIEREVASDSLLTERSKSCGLCGIRNKPFCKFGHDVALWGGRTPSGACKACIKNKMLTREYGITLREYQELWNFQSGRCAICGKLLADGTGRPGWISDNEENSRLGRPELDHEHGGRKGDKDKVRGILCGGRWSGCNRKIGRIDDILWLSNVLKYLQDPPAKQLAKQQILVPGSSVVINRA